jgi:hypothetical protein
MNVHKNARLTPSGRELLLNRIQSGWSAVRAARLAVVSRKVVSVFAKRCFKRDPTHLTTGLNTWSGRCFRTSCNGFEAN